MFTGLIESVGEIAEVAAIDAGFRLRVMSDIAAGLHLGESVSVNGVCLTVVEQKAGSFSADIGPETAKVTSLGGMKSGSPVNLERAMAADGRFGGHMVLGHVDGTGTVQSVHAEADFWWVSVGYPGALAPYLIHRGRRPSMCRLFRSPGHTRTYAVCGRATASTWNATWSASTCSAHWS